MSKVAFLGLGAMGSRMATNLLRAGHELTVWNLTPEPTKTLVASGAKPATTPREAAEGNEFIVTMVTNDVASRHVWLDAADGALLGMRSGAIAIDSSTLTPAWVRELASVILRDSVPSAAPRKGPGLHCANWGRRSIDANRERCTKHFPKSDR